MGLRSLLGGRGRARDDREAATRLASVEAAQDDALFDAEVVQARAISLFIDIQRAWSVNDVTSLRRLVGPQLMIEWEARLRDFRAKGWRNVVDVLEGPDVRYVGVTNRSEDSEDRVVVRLNARLRDVVIDRDGRVLPSDEGEVARVSEYWTLGKRSGDWVVVSIEQEREGAHHLSAPLIAAPDSDSGRLRAEAVMELAAADAIAADEVGALLSPAFAGSARAAALDLSLIDGRFAPDVLSTAIAEVLEAWAQAIDGPDEPLAARTTPHALRALLYPTASDSARLVIRGQDMQASIIIAVTAGPPALVRLQIDVAGVQYIEDRNTTRILAGTKNRRSTTRQLWTLRLSDDPRTPWIVTDATGVIPR
jgi:predicted lipid-binding transport protein (Tim44 family)